MAKPGRPRTPIRWEEFDKLCGLQCTLREIAGWFHCTEDTIENAVRREHKIGFSAYYAEKSAAGKISLRRRQYKAAESGNVTMLIWLGKQWLRQSDKGIVEEATPESLARRSDAELLRSVADLLEQQRNAPIIPDIKENDTP